MFFSNIFTRNQEKDKAQEELDSLKEEYAAAQEEWRMAQHRFENADSEFVEMASYDLAAKEARVSRLCKDLKKYFN